MIGVSGAAAGVVVVVVVVVVVLLFFFLTLSHMVSMVTVLHFSGGQAWECPSVS